MLLNFVLLACFYNFEQLRQKIFTLTFKTALTFLLIFEKESEIRIDSSKNLEKSKYILFKLQMVFKYNKINSFLHYKKKMSSKI